MGQDTPKPIRALLVFGGCCHDYVSQKDILTKGVSKRTHVDWTIAYDPNTTIKWKNRKNRRYPPSGAVSVDAR